MHGQPLTPEAEVELERRKGGPPRVREASPPTADDHALMNAVMRRDMSMISFYTKSGANLDSRFWVKDDIIRIWNPRALATNITAAAFAATHAFEAEFEFIFEHPAYHMDDIDEVFIRAAAGGSIFIIKKVIARALPPRIASSWGVAVQLALFENRTEAALMLLNAAPRAAALQLAAIGLRVPAMDRRIGALRAEALAGAVRAGLIVAVRRMLETGVDARANDDAALRIAVLRGDTVAAGLLYEFGARDVAAIADPALRAGVVDLLGDPPPGSPALASSRIPEPPPNAQSDRSQRCAALDDPTHHADPPSYSLYSDEWKSYVLLCSGGAHAIALDLAAGPFRRVCPACLAPYVPSLFPCIV